MRASLPRAARWRAMAAERASTLRSRSGMSPRRSSTGRNSGPEPYACACVLSSAAEAVGRGGDGCRALGQSTRART